jgi:hypothetical protein
MSDANEDKVKLGPLKINIDAYRPQGYWRWTMRAEHVLCCVERMTLGESGRTYDSEDNALAAARAALRALVADQFAAPASEAQVTTQ